MEPKIIKLRKLEKQLSKARREQEKAEHDLSIIEDSLNALQEKLNDALGKQRLLEEDARSTSRKMDNAVTLITALGGEESRWQQQLLEQKIESDRLVGDCLISASYEHNALENDR